MNSALLAAISGCTRTLAGTPDTDAAFAAVEGATLGSLRAFGDRTALRQRYQNPQVHLAVRPSDPIAAAIYDALALARLDALGVQWLPGIATNLLAHPGTDDDGVRWLAFAAFSGQRPPIEKQTAASRIRVAVSASDLASLNDLG